MKDMTSIHCVIDRSGSMGPLQDDAIGGFNKFLDEQKKVPGEAEISIALFDDQYDIIANGVKIKDAQPFTHATYVPRGMTALYDAIGKTMNEAGTRFSNMPESERPNKVLFIILTDGQENSSKEFTKDKIFEMIKTQKEKYNWEFIYLGANQDAMAVGGSIGIGANNCMSYTNDSAGTSKAYATVSCCTSNFRNTGSAQINYVNKTGDDNDRLN